MSSGVGSACFYPNIGVVVEDIKTNTLSELYICMHCNNSEIYDKNGDFFYEVKRQDGNYGYSPIARKKIRSLFANYGFTTKNTYTVFYDYIDDYIESQLRNGRDSIDILDEISEHDTNENLNTNDTVSHVAWENKRPTFFTEENIDTIIYEYDITGGDRYTHYVGKMDIKDSTYYVFNVFRRIQAAVVLHGHSSLHFVNHEQKSVAEYSVSFPYELPKKVVDNKLEFHIENNTYLVTDIDFSLPYLCIEQEVLCIPKIE